LASHCDRFRSARGLSFEALVEAPERRFTLKRLVAFDEQLPPLLTCQQRQPRDPQGRLRNDRPEQRLEVTRHAADSLSFEQVGAVFYCPFQRPIPLAYQKRQIELRGHALRIEGSELQALKIEAWD